MSVWVCVPSARSVPEVDAWAAKWRERGYSIALWCDSEPTRDILYDFVQVGPYPGYAQATNALIKWVLDNDRTCDWVVATGDDTDPDPNHTADEIAAQCSEHFGLLASPFPSDPFRPVPFNSPTFGVMQPTGDRWGDDAHSRAMWPNAPAYIDRIAGSPWIGRSFAERINQGQGPLWPEYTHCFADEELQLVAEKLGVFWQRRDLTHHHNHWLREGKTEPAHLVEANKTLRLHRPLFEARRKMGFPGSEPIA